MYLQKVYELTGYLSDESKAPDEVAKFITLKTLINQKSAATYFAEVTLDAHLALVAGFGQEEFALPLRERIPLATKHPLADAAKNEEWIHIKSWEDFVRRYPDLNDSEHIMWKGNSILVWPILPFGVGFTALDSNCALDEEFDQFLKVISGMFYSHYIRYKSKFNQKKKLSSPISHQSDSLSPRQNKIIEHLRQGRTNAEIASQLGYSESLIRQETVKIYRTLNITGRKELLEQNDSI
jgi:DNA-binding CsgD family transcriptional regulator